MSDGRALGWGKRSFNPAGCAPLRQQWGSERAVAFWGEWVYSKSVIDRAFA